MTNEMIERVARAICKSRFLNGGNEDDDGWDDAPEAIRSNYRAAARAAIEAMREPTAVMTSEAWADATAEDPVGVWRTMIDTAIADPLPVHKAKME